MFIKEKPPAGSAIDERDFRYYVVDVKCHYVSSSSSSLSAAAVDVAGSYRRPYWRLWGASRPVIRLRFPSTPPPPSKNKFVIHDTQYEKERKSCAGRANNPKLEKVEKVGRQLNRQQQTRKGGKM